MPTDNVWQWPLALDTFDIVSPLTNDEVKAVAELLCLRDQPRRIVGYANIAQKRLPRLVTPIRTALTYANFATEYHSPVIYRFLKCTADTNMAYGQLADADWIPMLMGKDEGTLLASVATKSQYAFLIALYLLHCFKDIHHLHNRKPTKIAQAVFGNTHFNTALNAVIESLKQLGYSASTVASLQVALAEILLVHRSPYLADIDRNILQHMRVTTCKSNGSRFVVRLSYALFGLGILNAPLPKHPPRKQTLPTSNTWEHWVHRWKITSPLMPATRKGIANILRQVGIWLNDQHSPINSPEQWDRQTCLDFISAACNLHRGEWAQTGSHNDHGNLLKASTRRKKIDAVRKFFQDLQAWEWIPKRFNPRMSLTAPAYLHAQIGPNPRIIASDIWTKLLQAALNLNPGDIQPNPKAPAKNPSYPLEMVQAIALVWVFGGLRNDEIRRLQVGCVRWEEADEGAVSSVIPLRIPANKTSGRFEKPVSHIVAEAIREWEAIRPDAPPLLDRKTGKRVHFLFMYRGRYIGQGYLNRHLIPMLCKKADVPLADAKGKITSHRARATMGNALVTGKNAITLLELKTWLGHRSVSSTLHYVKPSPTHMAQAYTNTDYFERNLRLVDVLVDQDAVRAGGTDNWLHYDLGHGYCTNDFFVKCAHRMACARCAFYLPKASTQAQLLEAKTNLRHMMQEIELTDEETAAVEGDLTALEHLVESLQVIPTPDKTLSEGVNT